MIVHLSLDRYSITRSGVCQVGIEISSEFSPKKLKDKRMERAVSVCAELFLERGIESVKMTDIADYSGIGVATLYRYFGTKTGIAIDAMTFLWDDLKSLFGGVFSKEFILFFGENLQYYITEEAAGEEKLTYSDSIGISETISGDDSSRYHILNDMGVAKNLKDENTLIDLMNEYTKKDYFTERGFSIL